MQQIYNFEVTHPPVLTEQMLRHRIEQHILKQHTILLAIAGLLLELLIFLAALLLLPVQPVISVVCISYNIFP